MFACQFRPPLALLLTLLVASLAAGPAGAAPRDLSGSWGLGLQAGYVKLVEGEWDYSNVDQFAALHLDRGLSRSWTLQASFFYGTVRPGVDEPGLDAGWTLHSGSGLYTVMTRPALTVRHRFLPDSRFCPVLGGGVGLTSWKVVDQRGEDPGFFVSGDPVAGYDSDGNPADLEGSELTLLLELGLDVSLSDNLMLNLGARAALMPGNDRDNVGFSGFYAASPPRDLVDANTAGIEGFLGVTWWFGSTDRDGDGILNRDDGCPQLPEDMDGFQDEDGCPDADNDQDGLADTLDRCPDQPEDRDGFEDQDGCPEADNDQDGIIDGQDGCPEEAEDVDGFQDEDGCPDPDNDGDGVNDEQDRCPDTDAGVAVDQYGCSQVAQIKPMLILEGVTFLSGSAQLTPESVGTLTRVADSLRSWPAQRIEIRGHTDSTGDAEANRELSHRRALSVRDALVQMGVEPGRITAVGYGEDFPIADNTTPEGRKLNRRVELHRVD